MNLFAQEPTPQAEYRTIPLTKGQFALVDAADFHWLNQWKWFARWSPTSRTFYAQRSLYPPSPGAYCIVMHRQIMDARKGMEVDHRDHDGLNNRRDNLRICTPSQNHSNARLSPKNKSGYKGVSWSKAEGKWRAQLKANRKYIWLGHFTDPREAHAAYQKACIEEFEDFANPFGV